MDGGSMSSKGAAMDSISPVVSGFDGFVYKVQFKRAHRNFLRSTGVDKPLKVGDFVVVEADRGEDLGIICEVQPMPVFFREGGSLFPKDSKVTAWGDRRNGVKHIIRHAVPQEHSLLPVKFAEELSVVEVCFHSWFCIAPKLMLRPLYSCLQSCREQCRTYLLPMLVVDAE